jgi:hypothetical protein
MTWRLEQHEASDFAALDRLELRIHVLVVARGLEPADVPGEVVEAAPWPTHAGAAQDQATLIAAR